MTETLEPTTTAKRRVRSPLRPDAPTSAGAARNQRRALAVGGAPRVDLLPSEVHVARRQRAAVRRVWAGVVVVAIGVGAVSGWAVIDRGAAEKDLLSAQEETTSLAQQQGQFRDVRTTESATTLLEAAQQVGGATEVDWSSTLRSVQGKLPQGVTISGVTVDSASATAAYAQSDDPLQGLRIATLTLDAKSASLPSVPAWLSGVRGVTGFVDANVNSVARAQDGSGYTVNMTIHLDEKAFDDRYAAKKG